VRSLPSWLVATVVLAAGLTVPVAATAAPVTTSSSATSPTSLTVVLQARRPGELARLASHPAASRQQRLARLARACLPSPGVAG